MTLHNHDQAAGDNALAKIHGFTLLEVMIATIVAALMFGMLLRTALSGIRVAHDASAYEMATVLVRSHLALLGRNMADAPAESHGRDGLFDWQMRVQPEAFIGTGTGIVNWFLHKDEVQTRLYTVSITISWQNAGQRQELQVSTQRLGFAPPPPPEPE